MRKITRWSEGGNARDRTAQISRERTPVHLEVIDFWLAWSHQPMDWMTNWLQNRERVDVSRWFAWPCEAYTQAWIPWLYRHRDVHVVDIDFDRLSPDYREWLVKFEAWLDEPDNQAGEEPRYRP